MWKTEYRCVSCNQRLSEFERMYSHGRCPCCGYKSPSAGTIVDTTERAYRTVVTWSMKFPFRHTKRVYLEGYDD